MVHVKNHCVRPLHCRRQVNFYARIYQFLLIPENSASALPGGGIGLNLTVMNRHITILGSTVIGKPTPHKNVLRGLLRQGIPFSAVDWEKSYLTEEDGELSIFTIPSKASPFHFNYFIPPDGISNQEYTSYSTSYF